MISAAQLRAARVLLGLSQADVAKKAKLSIPTIKRGEADEGIRVSDEARSAIQRVLEAAGVIFVEENGEGPGVRLKKSKRK